MKILRLTTELNYGGIEKVFELHAKYHDHSSELVFVALSRGGNTQQLLQEMGYKVIVLNVERVSIPSFTLIKILIKIFRQEKPDVVHAAGAEANFHVPIAARLASVKGVICEEIGIPNHSQKAKLFFRFIYKLSDNVIAISKAVEHYLVSSKEAPANKVNLIYNPVNKVTHKLEHHRQELLFTVVARLEPVKNLSFLIDVFSGVLQNFQEARLNIIGDGSLRKQLQEQIDNLKLSGKINLKGFLADPQPELSESTFFILPSLFEGFGLACIEAIQAGNIVLCTNSGGIPEFINDGEEGFLFDPKSKISILNAIDKAINLSLSDRNQMVMLAQRKINNMFSPTMYIEQLNSLYSGTKALSL